MTYSIITREIGLDMGHRIPEHGSKCRDIHGHRYTVQASCRGELQRGGEQDGMVLDFSFLKEEMMTVIHDPCDHRLCLSIDDKLCALFLKRERLLHAAAVLKMNDYVVINDNDGVNLYIIAYAPTAEILARHWFNLLAPRVKVRSNGVAHLLNIRVWETPNCCAEFYKSD